MVVRRLGLRLWVGLLLVQLLVLIKRVHSLHRAGSLYSLRSQVYDCARRLVVGVRVVLDVLG